MSHKETIERYYEKLNYPGTERLFKEIIKKHPSITKDEVKTFVNDQLETQLLNPGTKGKGGHIVALQPNEIWEVDIFELLSYGKQNKGNLHIYCVVDVFTRKAYARPMKTKTMKSAAAALTDIIRESGAPPIILISDNDSAFYGSDYQTVLTDNDIIFEPNVVNDHNALGIIDNFAKRLKTILSKKFIRNDSVNWVDHLQEVIDNYNESPNTSIDDIAPNNAKNHISEIFEINQNKSMDGMINSDLEKGDRVRIKTTGTFKKASDLQFSTTVYEVVKVNKGKITLNDDKVYKRNMLLKVNAELGNKKDSAIKTAKLDAKIENALKKDGIIRNDSIEPLYENVKNRIRKKKQIFDA